MPTASINGASIYYREKGMGPAVLLLHGFPVSHAMWDAQVDALAGRYRLVAPDYRGFGRSTNPGGAAYSIEQLADDAHQLVGRLGLAPVVVGGLSMGGYVALAYAAKYGDTLRGLMLFDTKAEADNEAAREGRAKMIEVARRQGSGAVADLMIPKLIPEAAAHARPQLVRDLRTMTEGNDPEALALALAAMRDRPDRTAELGRIGVPTLLVGGQLDVPTPPEVMAAMHGLIPRSVHRVIPSAGHMSPMEQPQLVTNAMEAYLGGL